MPNNCFRYTVEVRKRCKELTQHYMELQEELPCLRKFPQTLGRSLMNHNEGQSSLVPTFIRYED